MIWLCSLLPALLILFLLVCLICFLRVFYSPTRKALGEDEFEIPSGEIYEVYREQMVKWMKEVRKMPHEKISITSHDGLTLRGRYYETSPDAPVEILFHGYRGNAERDLCGGVARAFAVGRNALIVDHRGSGSSDGHVITFGILERRDALLWINEVIRRKGEDVQVYIGGISMGAATVLMVSGEKDLPKNVVGVLADCPYTSAKEIICKVIREMGLPAKLLYPFVKLGARIYGGFDLEESSPIEATARASVPTIFYHGDTDDFVPHEMGVRLFEACSSEKKRFISVPGAGHGLAFSVDKEAYIQNLREFIEDCK